MGIDLISFLNTNNLSEAIGLECDGKLYRFNRDGRNNGWFIGFQNKTKSQKDYLIALVGDWKTGETYKFESSKDLTTTEKKEVEDYIKKAQAAVKAQKEQKQLDTAIKVSNEWETFDLVGESNYLLKSIV